MRRYRNGNNLAIITAVLAYLEPDISYPHWIRIGMALHNETGGADEGFVIWDDWSSSGLKYPGEHRLRQHWGYFKRSRGKPVTMGTIIWIAREHDVDTDSVQAEFNRGGAV